MIKYLPRQMEALEALANDCPAEVVLFGGAAGGSKSFTACAWQIMRRVKYPGTRGLLGRSKLDTLKKTTLRTFFEVAQLMGLKSGKHYTFNGQSNIITFWNGSELILKDLFAYPSDPNFDSLGGLEISDAIIEEVAQVTKKAVDIVRSRMRYKLKEYNLAPKLLMTCNPTKGWLYNDIYDPWRNGALNPRYRFIPALPGDNPHLPESYLDILRTMNEVDRKRLMEGDWDFDESIDQLFNYTDLLRCFQIGKLEGEYFITGDIARLGKDRTVIGLWRGFELIEIKELRKSKITETVAVIKSMISAKGVKLGNVILDEDGIGGGAVDLVACRGFQNGSRAKHPETYTNLKAECYFKLAELIEKGKVSFPENYRDTIVKELDMIRRRRPEADGKLSVTSKEELNRMHGISPDFGDMIMMRCYFELYPNYGRYAYA